MRTKCRRWSELVSCPRNKHIFRCDQNGPPARREEGAYLDRYVTDPAAAGQPPAHFHRNPPGRGQLAVFPRCSLLTYRFRYDRRSRLEKQPTDLRRKACLFRGQDTGMTRRRDAYEAAESRQTCARNVRHFTELVGIALVSAFRYHIE